MKKLLFISICFICLIACGNQRKQNNTTPEAQTIATEQSQQEADKIPHIFHGMTKSISIGDIGENGDIVGFTEHKLYAVKYALYLDNGLVVIFDDNTQHHKIIMYIGSEECEDSTRYLFATYDQNENQGYVEFDYCNNGSTLMMVDYEDYIIGYILETFMPQAEFKEHLKKYNRE